LSRYVVDTNIPVIANGRDTHASPKCQLRAVEFLTKLVKDGCTTVDKDGEIFEEYSGRLYPQGQPGVGDLFFRHLLDHQGNAQRLRQVDVSDASAENLREAFSTGPLKDFDKSDRKFALCSVVDDAPVATATDSDWAQHSDALIECNVKIHYVCGKKTAASGGMD
jgi:hypothetical protein